MFEALQRLLFYVLVELLAEWLRSSLRPRPVEKSPPAFPDSIHRVESSGTAREPTIFFASGSAELDADARARLAAMVDEFGMCELLSVTLAASFDPNEAADRKAGRALARARAKAVQDALENAGLSLTYFSRIGERDATVRIELPPRAV